MAVTVRFEDWHDCVHIINCLLAVADTRGPEGAVLANRLNRIANDLGDAVDRCPVGVPPATYKITKKEVDESGYDLVVS